MHTKQTIAIIGATGEMGAAMAKSLVKGNYRLLLKGNDQNALDALVNDILKMLPTAEIEVAVCSADACWEADIIILAVPFSEESKIAEKVKEVANQKIVISISNPHKGAENELPTAPIISAAEKLQQQLPHSKVVKAFNTLLASAFANPVLNGQQVDTLLAGNDEEALLNVGELATSAGLNPIVVGDLTASRTLENMQVLLQQLDAFNNYSGLAAWKLLHN